MKATVQSRKIMKSMMGAFMNDVNPINDEHLKKELYALSPLVVHKDRKKVRADTRTHELKYSWDNDSKNVPTPLVKLYDICCKQIDDEETFACSIHYVASMPKANVVIPKPSRCVVRRCLFNLGYKEVYNLHRDVIGDSCVGNVMRSHKREDIFNDMSSMVPADYFLNMNAGIVCDYTITCSSVPPPTYSIHENLNSAPSTHTFIRFPGQKICIVVDIISLNPEYLRALYSEMDTLNNITEEEILESINNINLNVLNKNTNASKKESNTSKKERSELVPEAIDEDLLKEMEG